MAGVTLCYAIVLPGRQSGVRLGFRPDSSRENLKISTPAGRRADFEAFPIRLRPGSPISGPEAVLCNIMYVQRPRLSIVWPVLELIQIKTVYRSRQLAPQVPTSPSSVVLPAPGLRSQFGAGWDPKPTLCYAIVLPGLKAVFRAGFRPDSNRESFTIGPLAGKRPAGEPILKLSRIENSRHPTRKANFRPGSIIV